MINEIIGKVKGEAKSFSNDLLGIDSIINIGKQKISKEYVIKLSRADETVFFNTSATWRFLWWIYQTNVKVYDTMFDNSSEYIRAGNGVNLFNTITRSLTTSTSDKIGVCKLKCGTIMIGSVKFSDDRAKDVSNNDENISRLLLSITISVKFIGPASNRYYSSLVNYVTVIENHFNTIEIEAAKTDGKASIGIGSFNISKNATTGTTLFIKKKSMDDIFMDKVEKDKLIHYVTEWNSNKDLMELYHRKSISYSTGILLHGIPGCGKTTLIRAIASILEANIYTVSIKSMLSESKNYFSLKDSMSEDRGMHSITQQGMINGTIQYSSNVSDRFVRNMGNNENRYNCGTNKYQKITTDKEIKPTIYVFEDIDSLFVNRRDTSDKELAAIQNTLLQFMDGLNVVDKRLIIMTTNHLDLIEGEDSTTDTALTRPGRINYRVEMKPINKELAEEMCLSFDTTLDKVIPDFKDDDVIAPSKLENEIILNLL